MIHQRLMYVILLVFMFNGFSSDKSVKDKKILVGYQEVMEINNLILYNVVRGFLCVISSSESIINIYIKVSRRNSITLKLS